MCLFVATSMQSFAEMAKRLPVDSMRLSNGIISIETPLDSSKKETVQNIFFKNLDELKKNADLQQSNYKAFLLSAELFEGDRIIVSGCWHIASFSRKKAVDT